MRNQVEETYYVSCGSQTSFDGENNKPTLRHPPPDRSEQWKETMKKIKEKPVIEETGPRRPLNDTYELILSPSGRHYLTMRKGQPTMIPQGRIDPPSRPRLKHHVSLEDSTEPPPVEEDDDYGLVKRINPCGCCEMNFAQSAMNFALVSIAGHLYLLAYSISLFLHTEDYAQGFLTYWGVNTGFGNDAQMWKHFYDEIYTIGIYGTVNEAIGILIAIEVIYGIAKERKVLVYLWILVSTCTLAMECLVFGYYAFRLTYILYIPLGIATFMHGYGLWAVIVYLKNLDDPKKCPNCQVLLGRFPFIEYTSAESLCGAPCSPKDKSTSTTHLGSQTLLEVQVDMHPSPGSPDGEFGAGAVEGQEGNEASVGKEQQMEGQGQGHWPMEQDGQEQPQDEEMKLLQYDTSQEFEVTGEERIPETEEWASLGEWLRFAEQPQESGQKLEEEEEEGLEKEEVENEPAVVAVAGPSNQGNKDGTETSTAKLSASLSDMFHFM